MAAGGVKNNDGAILFLSPFDSAFGCLDEIGFAWIGSKYGNIDLFGKLRELVDRCGTIKIKCNKEGAPALFFEAKC